MTAHGFRAMAKTTLKQRLKYRDELTEMQLGHEVKICTKSLQPRDLLMSVPK
ncbi:MAG: hypothetical protein R3E67_02660 [Pseudomonadales bacterium]